MKKPKSGRATTLTAAMVLPSANAPVVLFGDAIAKRLPLGIVRVVAALLFVALGVELAKTGLAWYVGVMPAYSTIYGAFATVPIVVMIAHLLVARTLRAFDEL